MEVRAEHCRKEAARYAAWAKPAQNKIDRTKAMVLCYLESHDLKQLETEDTTLRRQKNSQDSVIVLNADAIPPDLKRYELKVAGDIWMKVCQQRGANEPSDQTVLRERQDHRWRRRETAVCSKAEMRKLLNRKIVEQNRQCAICQVAFTNYSDIVPDHIDPRGMGGSRRDDHPENIQAAHFWCNGEKGSTREY
jgi:hypothetical protein